MIVSQQKAAGCDRRLTVDWEQWTGCALYLWDSCVRTPVGLQSERPMCLGVSDLMTPLTALIHTQVLVHILKK